MRLPLFFLSAASSILLLSSPLNAANFQSWHFNPTRNQLNLTTDSGVQPRAFLINNPTRLVIDLPGTQLRGNTKRKKYSSSVREVRVGKVDDKTTRLVVELAPGYTVSPEKVLVKGDTSSHWIVNFSSIERTISNANNNLGEEKIPVPFPNASSFAGVVPLGSQMPQLYSQVKSLMSRYSYLDPGMFFLDLETGDYLDINGEKAFPAASTIKLPLLVALFEEVDAGRVKLNETVVMRRDLMTGGSGTMRYKRPGTKFGLLETVTKMITISDNTATNMVIDRLGGKARLNQRFRSWGLQNTVIRNLLGDFKGTNTTSPKDLARVGALISNNLILSSSSRAKVLDIMHRVRNKAYLGSGIGKNAKFANKTGTLGIVLGDTGIVTMPNGKRYLAGMIVRRPFRDRRAKSFIKQVSRIVYGHINKPQVSNLPK
ncbi:peptidoglycan glycosyltransferase [Calothrix parasitica NIES-267]|uniref:Peptidoglycan glycosyltransferase n=1 Tax=Calothrix parasitica NIES-267 TaxID=1973488 RepID=A0A1Z4LIM0_9CYAN|nr:peptidoglycan glycosyltransferase [Calothrix parasitica NIES-267]